MDVLDYRKVESDRRQSAGGEAASEERHVISGSNPDTRDRDPVTHLLACFQDDPSKEIWAYADYLCSLLNSQISFIDLPAARTAPWIKFRTGDCDLLVFEEPKQSFIERLLAGQEGHRAVSQAPVSMLLTRRPRWPIKTILMITRTEETDEAALEWVGRLARPSGATVTILPVLCSFPSVYAPACSEETALGEILSPNTQPGRQLRDLCQQLTQWQITASLRLRQGEPEWQLRWESAKGDYDLIVIGAEPDGRWRRWLGGELVAPMLRWANRPLLIARPTQSAQGPTGVRGHD